MSVVMSEQGYNHKRRPVNHRPFRQNGFMSNKTVIGGGGSFDQQYLLPQFSAAASEGATRIDVENWADNTTVITDNTNEEWNTSGIQQQTFQPVRQSLQKTVARRCSRICWLCSAFFVSFISLISAPIMITFPILANNFNIFGYPWIASNCEVDCQGTLLNMGAKMVLLVVTFCILYWRRAPADMPRLFFHRIAFTFFVFFVLFAFWLFYIVRIVLEQNQNYYYIVSYASSLVDVLLFIHSIWIFSELRQFKSVYFVTIVRDPDGECHTHEIGEMSIQEAAVYVLRFYYTYFSMFNPNMELVRNAMMSGNFARFRSGNTNPAGTNGFKLYDIDGRGETTLSETNARILMEAASRRRTAGHNEYFFEELEWERRHRKRKSRLISCTEEVFAQFKATNGTNTNSKIEPMDPSNVAKAILGGILKPMTRFLKFNRVFPFHPSNEIGNYLQRCLSYGFSARTFLARFFSNRTPSHEIGSESKWSIICEDRASKGLRHGTYFVLRSHNSAATDRGIQLYCTFTAFPFFNITEQPTPRKAKFSLKISNEYGV